MQSGALVGEPLLAFDVGIFAPLLAAGFFRSAVLAEFLVRFDFGGEFANDDFDVDGVIQESQSRHVVRNQVFRIAEVNECPEDTATL